MKKDRIPIDQSDGIHDIERDCENPENPVSTSDSAIEMTESDLLDNERSQTDDPIKNDGNTASSSKTKIRAATVLAIISFLFVTATVIGIALMWEYFYDATWIRNIVADHYILGAVIMVLVTALQVVIAFIPGELVEIAAGLVFGAIPGTVLVLIGAMLGSVISILLTKKFGINLVKALFPKADINSLPIMNNKKQRNLMTFLLFLIPGTPKDMLTYVIGLTDMKIWQYLLLTTFARIPSIISSTAGGDAFGSSNLLLAIYIFAGIAIVSLVGYVIYGHISKKGSQKSGTKKNK